MSRKRNKRHREAREEVKEEKRSRTVDDVIFEVGEYHTQKGKAGMTSHHAPGKSLMGKFGVKGYNKNSAPAILIPAKGHNVMHENPEIGMVEHTPSSRDYNTPRKLLGYYILDLVKVYGNVKPEDVAGFNVKLEDDKNMVIPKEKLLELIQLNKDKFSEMANEEEDNLQLVESILNGSKKEVTLDDLKEMGVESQHIKAIVNYMPESFDESLQAKYENGAEADMGQEGRKERKRNKKRKQSFNR